MTETSDPTARQSPHAIWAGVHHTLRSDVTAGVLLLAATVTALALANSPAVTIYERVRDYTIGPEGLHLHLTLGAWAADGLLAIFFFVVGLELKEEFVVGKLRDPRAAALPIAAAVAGVVIPALVFVAVNRNAGGEVLRGWAIPTATDIAFAVAIIAVIGRSLPSAVRTFLLTLAIVDDLLAITIIATVYTDDLAFLPLLAAFVPLAVFAFAVQRGTRAWLVLLPLAVLTWALIHASGIHATVAGAWGVVLGNSAGVKVIEHQPSIFDAQVSPAPPRGQGALSSSDRCRRRRPSSCQPDPAPGDDDLVAVGRRWSARWPGACQPPGGSSDPGPSRCARRTAREPCGWRSTEIMRRSLG